MKKVLLIQGRITHYRVPVFNELAKRVDLTVLYSVGDEPENINFKVIKIPIIQISKIVIFKKTLRILAKKFDAVIAPLEFNNISIMALPIKPRPYKVIYWSIGVPASYDVPYDSSISS